MQSREDEIFSKPRSENVFLNQKFVGRLASTPENLCAFDYDSNYLKRGYSISPFFLPLKQGVFVARRDPFSCNFGVFNDSLPDGWGNLLLDRFLISQNINPAELSVLDRLSLVGSSGMGALEYKPDNSFISNGNYHQLMISFQVVNLMVFIQLQFQGMVILDIQIFRLLLIAWDYTQKEQRLFMK